MRAPVVVELDPVGDDPAGVLQAFDPVPVRALHLECPDHTLHHLVLLWSIGGDVLLVQTVAAYQSRVGTAGEHQAIV